MGADADGPEPVLRWLDRLDVLDRDGAGVVFGHDADVPPADVLARVPDRIVVDGVPVHVEPLLNRDFMPLVEPGETHPVTAFVGVRVLLPPSAGFPRNLRAERMAALCGGEVWTVRLRETYSHRSAESPGFVARAVTDGPGPPTDDPRGPVRPGPWAVGTPAEVLVRLRDGAGAVHVVRVTGLRIERSE